MKPYSCPSLTGNHGNSRRLVLRHSTCSVYGCDAPKMTPTLIFTTRLVARGRAFPFSREGRERSPSTGFNTGLRGTTAVLDPREEGPAFRAVYYNGRRNLVVYCTMKLSCGLERRESPADSHAVF